MSNKEGCIYCGEKSDLSISDIIPDALTNGKICNKYVCRKMHNNQFSDAFEYEVIDGLSAITNALNVKSSKGKSYAKYPAEVIIDGISYDTKISSESELFHGNKILKSKDGKHFLGSMDKLAQFKQAKIEDILEIDINEKGIEKRITVDLSIFFCDSMYRLMAKIAFEWYCLCNDVQSKCEELESIIKFITDGIGNNPVKIICSGDEQTFNSLIGDMGNHTLILYVPQDGSLNVIISLFGIALYNVKLCEKVPQNCKYRVNYTSINLDGKRTEFRAKTEDDLCADMSKQFTPMGNVGGLQVMVPQNMHDNTITAKMFYLTSSWLHQGLDTVVDEIKLCEGLKKNVDYILKMSSFTWHGLKRFVKEYESIIDVGVKINEKSVISKSLFLFYLLFMLGQANGSIGSFEELNNQVVRRFGKREIELSYDVCKRIQEEMLTNVNYPQLIKDGAKIVLEM
jgi:hypothetical protein